MAALVAGAVLPATGTARPAEPAHRPLGEDWQPAGTLGAARRHHGAVLLPDGTVLVGGGAGSRDTLDGAELFDPATNRWRPTGTMTAHRWCASATVLPGGQVLVAGGHGADFTALDGAERFTVPAVPPTDTPAPTPSSTPAVTPTQPPDPGPSATPSPAATAGPGRWQAWLPLAARNAP